MHRLNELRFRSLLPLFLALFFPALMVAQNEGVSASAESSPSHSVKQRLEILRHIGQTAPTEAPAGPVRLDPRSRDKAPQTSPPLAVQLPGAPIAAERYVFGRMDLATGDYPSAVATGAFQTGGPQSIAVANYSYPGSVSIYLANSDGTYRPRVDYTTGLLPDGLCVADLNGDHNLDLAVANWSSGTVSVLLGKGDGTFQTHVDYYVGGFVSQVIAADFNHDGKMDLAAVVGVNENIVILMGNGDGTLQPAVPYAVGNSAEAIVAGDFNGDNRIDLAVAGASDQVAILLGNGDGTFQPPVQMEWGRFPWPSWPGTLMATTNSIWRRPTPPATRFRSCWAEAMAHFKRTSIIQLEAAPTGWRSRILTAMASRIWLSPLWATTLCRFYSATAMEPSTQGKLMELA